MKRKSLSRGFVILMAATLLAFASVAWAHFPGVRFLPVAGGFIQPTHITNAGDGTGRLFVVEQGGTIRIISNGSVLPTPFLDISDRIITGGERGLLSVAFPPDFRTKRYFYVNYTRYPDGATVVARYRVTNNRDVADPASEDVLLVVSQPFANHNGGMMAFSPADGFLYIGMGDGGSGGDPNNFAQNTTPLPGNQHLLGKILRIDVESGIFPYAIPESNPRFGGLRNEIWSIGLRNPWKFSFDRRTGDIYIGDVGQRRMEEINFRPASSKGGENYGWRILEGSLCFNPATGCVPPPGYVPPVTEYSHDLGCSVTGGYIYRGTEFAGLRDLYFFGDFCSGRIWGLHRAQGGGFQRRLLADTGMRITTFGEGEDGSVYVADRALGNVFKIAATVAVLSPNGGEVIPAGSEWTIRWNKARDIEASTVQFSTDNGRTWTTIGRMVTGTSITWNVPPLAQTSRTCRVRVIGFSSGAVAGRDASDNTFTITAGP